MKTSLRAGVLAFLTTLPVLSGQNQAVSVANTPTWLQVPHASSLVPSTAITLESWVRHNPATSGSEAHVIRKNPQPFNESYDLRHRSNAVEAVFRTTGTGAGLLNSGVTLQPLVWQHIAATFDGATVRIYLDGALISQAALTGTVIDTGGVLHIGHGQLGANDWWGGQIDEVRIWRVARTQAEIQVARFQEISWHPDLVAVWHFNGTYLDSAAGHHATPVGSVPFVPGPTSLAAALFAPALSSIGSPLVWQLRFQQPWAPYVFDVSTGGTSPGVVLPGGFTVPLNPPWLAATYGAQFPGAFSGFAGVFNSLGEASAVLAVPAWSALAGVNIDAAFATFTNAPAPALASVQGPVRTTLVGAGPVINGIAPVVGPQGGGTAVTLLGANFALGSQVRFDGVLAASIVVVSPQTITCLTPPGLPGSADVSVTSPGGALFTAPAAFTYVPTLVATAISPIVAAPGAVVTVTGSGIHPEAVLTVGGSPVTPLAASTEQISFVNPPNVPCHTQATIQNPEGQTASLLFNPRPQIVHAPTAGGPASGGTTFWLLGSHFHPGTFVTVGGAAAAILGQTATTLLLVAPPGVPGPAPVVVSSLSGCQNTTTFLYY